MTTVSSILDVFKLPSDKQRDEVDVTSVAYDQMAERWELLHALLGGTKKMRADSQWLPREPRESPTSYSLRIGRSFLYNAYADTVEKLVAKPFSRPVTVDENLPPLLRPIEDNVDLAGTNLTQMCRAMLRAGVIYGLTHVLVDMPTKRTGENEIPTTLRDDLESNHRPVFRHVTPPELIGWRTSFEKGFEELVQVRIKERRVEPMGEFSEQVIDYVRVYDVNTWQLWKNGPSDKKYAIEREGTHPFGAVPLVTLYLKRTDHLVGEPPLEDLAWLNLAHWQSSSDQRNILRFARVGILFGAGFEDEELEEQNTIGANRLVRSSNKDAKLEYVEHSGQAIPSGEQDLENLEERMEVLGMAPFVSRTGDETATGKAMDEARTHSTIQAWIRAEERAMRQCYEMAARWTGDVLSDEFSVDIFNEFGLSLRASEDITALIQMRKSREITRKTFLDEIKRRGLLTEAFNVELELANLEEEEPPMPPPGAFGEEEDEEDEEDEE